MEHFEKHFGTQIEKARQEAAQQTAQRITLEHEIVLQKIRMALVQIDSANAGVANELIRLHGSEDVIKSHNHAWDILKRLLWVLEHQEIKQ